VFIESTSWRTGVNATPSHIEWRMLFASPGGVRAGDLARCKALVRRFSRPLV
jgi:hypothetical protein